MNTIRYCIAVMLIAAIPAAIAYWLLIHPFARFWRSKGKLVTFSITCTVVLLVMISIFSYRSYLLALDWGTDWILVAVGGVFLAASGWLRKLLASELPIRVLVGIPEVTGGGRLITTGIYSRVRHPRYLQMDLALTGYALVANYPAAYLATLLWLVGIRVVAVFEEHELADRFGEEYRAYCRVVPRFIPRGIFAVRKER